MMARRLFTEPVMNTVMEALTDEWLPSAEVAERARNLGNRKHIRLNSNNAARIMRYMWTEGRIQRLTDSAGKMFYRRPKNEDKDSN